MLRNKPPKISLFSFQDIITTITGVMILVTLLTAMQLVNPAGGAGETSPNEVAEDTPTDLAERLTRLQAASEVLRQQLDELRAWAQQAAAASPHTIRELEGRREQLLAQAQSLRQWHALQAPEAKSDIAQTSAEQARLEQEVAARQAELAKAQRDARRAAAGGHRLYRFRSSGSKTWWIVDVGASAWRLWELDRQGRPTGRRQEFAQPRSAARLEAMQAWLAERPSRQEAFFLLGRPSAARDFRRLRDMLRERGFSLGCDLLGDGQTFDLNEP
ncbi:MAG: hypothetical protein NUV77_09880 [Thermoguttaceae bacterium]|jgi:uncharacterized protein YlxW (UPF0749 family)|nr:hypothetical protein [Thermoguttaceae bacterium]